MSPLLFRRLFRDRLRRSDDVLVKRYVNSVMRAAGVDWRTHHSVMVGSVAGAGYGLCPAGEAEAFEAGLSVSHVGPQPGGADVHRGERDAGAYDSEGFGAHLVTIARSGQGSVVLA